MHELDHTDLSFNFKSILSKHGVDICVYNIPCGGLTVQSRSSEAALNPSFHAPQANTAVISIWSALVLPPFRLHNPTDTDSCDVWTEDWKKDSRGCIYDTQTPFKHTHTHTQTNKFWWPHMCARRTTSSNKCACKDTRVDSLSFNFWISFLSMSNVHQDHLSPPGGCGPRWDFYRRPLDIFKEVILLSKKKIHLWAMYLFPSNVYSLHHHLWGVIQFAESVMPKSK